MVRIRGRRPPSSARVESGNDEPAVADVAVAAAGTAGTTNAASRPPTFAITAPTPLSSGVSEAGMKRKPEPPAPPARPSKLPFSCKNEESTSLSQALRKQGAELPRRSGLTTTAGAGELLYKVRDAISLQEENHNDVKNVYVESSEEDVLQMKLELEILKLMLVEEKTSHAQVGKKMTHLLDELKSTRHSQDIHDEPLDAQEHSETEPEEPNQPNVEIIESYSSDDDYRPDISEFEQTRTNESEAHISKLNIHAEVPTRQYKQKLSTSLFKRSTKKRRIGVNRKPEYASCRRLKHLNFKKGNTKCSVDDLSNLLDELSEVQKGYVEELGFKSLLTMQRYRKKLPDKLTWWLVSLVDFNSRTLNLGGEMINIDNMVPKILGVPSSGRKVMISDFNYDSNNELKRLLSTKGKGMKAKDLRDMIKGVEDKKIFSIYFMLLALCYYFAPNTTYNINRDYLTALRDVDGIKSLNWCEHAADILISGIKKFKTSQPEYMPGCVHILHLIFFIHVKGNKFTDFGELLINSVSEKELHDIVPPEDLITLDSVQNEETHSPNVDPDGHDLLIHDVSNIIKEVVSAEFPCCRKAKKNITDAKLRQAALDILDRTRQDR